MAFPQATPIAAGNTGANVTEFSATVHAGTIAAGDLLLLFVGNDGAGDSASVTDWTTPTNGSARANSAADNGEGHWFYKIADGNEASTVTVTLSSSEGAAYASYLIPAAEWHGTSVPEVASANPPSSVNPNPPSLTASWGAEDNLWFVAYAWDGNTSHVSYPADYTNDQQTSNWANSGGFGVAVASREAAAATEDPDTAEISASEQWAAFTLVVRPSGEVVNPTGTGAITAPAPTVSGTGAETFTATGAVSVPAPTVAGSGAETFTATGAVTVPAATVAGSGDHTEEAGEETTGTGAISAPAATVSGVGELVLTATGEVSAPAPTVVGSGAETFTATGAISAAAPTVSGTGSHLENVTGTGAISVPAPSVSGEGTSETIGTATATVVLLHAAAASIDRGHHATATVVLLHTATASVS